MGDITCIELKLLCFFMHKCVIGFACLRYFLSCRSGFKLRLFFSVLVVTSVAAHEIGGCCEDINRSCKSSVRLWAPSSHEALHGDHHQLEVH